MLKAGLIHQEANGIFYYLPLMEKAIEKFNKIIDKHMEQFGCCKIICPLLQNADRWKESGRYDAYGSEMLRITDRHNKELLFSPTAEEGFFFLVKNYIKSYKHLPKYMYQINWKFRDEISPRNGLLRGREFLMKDGYSFDNNFEDSQKTYNKLCNIYKDIFTELGIADDCILARGDSGPIGGDLNHEIILLTDDGDTTVWYNEIGLKNYDSLDSLKLNPSTVEISQKIETINYKSAKGIELGHLFNYGDKYGRTMDVSFTNSNGQLEYVHGGCYGIGVTRTIAAIIEKYSDNNGIIWPESIAPFKFYLIYKEENTYEAIKIYNQLGSNNVLMDDRKDSFGVKLQDADLLGIPYQIILGNNIELKIRKNGEILNFSMVKNLIDHILTL